MFKYFSLSAFLQISRLWVNLSNSKRWHHDLAVTFAHICFPCCCLQTRRASLPSSSFSLLSSSSVLLLLPYASSRPSSWYSRLVPPFRLGFGLPVCRSIKMGRRDLCVCVSYMLVDSLNEPQISAVEDETEAPDGAGSHCWSVNDVCRAYAVTRGDLT